MSSAVRAIVVLLLAQYCCADSLHLPNNFIGDDVSGSSALCMIDYSLGRADANLMNPQTVKIPKTLPFATTHSDGEVIPTTTNYVAPPLDWNLLASHASFAVAPIVAPIVAISKMISVIIGGASPQLTIIDQGEKVATTPSPTILMCSALEACSTSHVDARGKEEEGALAFEEAILRGLGGADANRKTSQTLEISKTHTLAETYAIGDNALGNEEECASALAFEETTTEIEETGFAGHDTSTKMNINCTLGADQFEDASFILQRSMPYASALFVTITTIILAVNGASSRQSMITVQGRRIMMIPFCTVMTYFTVVACLISHVDGLGHEYIGDRLRGVIIEGSSGDSSKSSGGVVSSDNYASSGYSHGLTVAKTIQYFRDSEDLIGSRGENDKVGGRADIASTAAVHEMAEGVIAQNHDWLLGLETSDGKQPSSTASLRGKVMLDRDGFDSDLLHTGTNGDTAKPDVSGEDGSAIEKLRRQDDGKVLSINSGSTLNERPLKGTQSGGGVLQSKNVSQLNNLQYFGSVILQ
ncbi:hypothetical protein ACHAW5_003676 [Stephanodiscus triporus]|uniref:Uncharacterized protein n=1 Tax=Stephanodiscus triporus TaxID=2934178 RepID=A0ABD3P8D9_9STRA